MLGWANHIEPTSSTQRSKDGTRSPGIARPIWKICSLHDSARSLRAARGAVPPHTAGPATCKCDRSTGGLLAGSIGTARAAPLKPTRKPPAKQCLAVPLKRGIIPTMQRSCACCGMVGGFRGPARTGAGHSARHAHRDAAAGSRASPRPPRKPNRPQKERHHHGQNR